MSAPEQVPSPRRRALLSALGGSVLVLALFGALVGWGLGRSENAARLAAEAGQESPSATATPSEAPTGTPSAEPSQSTTPPGTGHVAVPDVVGHQFEYAKQQLEAHGFHVVRRDEANEHQDEGTVVRVHPAGQAPSGSTITVYVASRKVTVPDLHGWDCQDAERKLVEESGLTVEKNGVPAPDGSSVGKVLGQHPAAGTWVEKGSPVRIDCGQPDHPAPTPSASAMTS